MVTFRSVLFARFAVWVSGCDRGGTELADKVHLVGTLDPGCLSSVPLKRDSRLGRIRRQTLVLLDATIWFHLEQVWCLFFLRDSTPPQEHLCGFFLQEVLIKWGISSRNVGGQCETSNMNTSTLERLATVDLTDSELLGALEDRFAERRAVDA